MTEADYARQYPIFIEREMVKFFKNSWERHTKEKELTWFSFRTMRRGVLDELKEFVSKGPWDDYRPSLVVDSHIQEDSLGNIYTHQLLHPIQTPGKTPHDKHCLFYRSQPYGLFSHSRLYFHSKLL